ncbi:MAG TPA: hypothetical protein PL048_20965 [Leptospiraceae bacterium]|nr:hypothetical protein [Leptospiraceae bacterium]HMY66825.1 hypothetical protein [Leptospiraceae bacterium]HMZ61257.1 hypothetical protein [Leptospiraceae bacterium]HNF15136.1 hypothetical protein [Leptospiraceae bacterium]HNF27672.1 hypothetical protein [Leptospiraceae bacterium]
MNNFKFYASNLYSENCIESADEYCQFFGWKITQSSNNHSELLTDSGEKIIFSRSNKNCRVEKGSITVVSDTIEPELSDFFQFEQRPEGKEYISILDRYGNRIWLFRK